MNDCVLHESDELVAVVPSVVDLQLVIDADTTFEFILTDGNCEPVDITNDSVIFTVRDYPGGTLKLQKTNASGEHSTPAQGKTEFTVARTDITDTLTDKHTKWVYEARRIQASGAESVHIEGDFTVNLSVGG